MINPAQDISMKIRLIDCVGFMIDGATGVVEDGKERLVKTPWYDYEIPFSEAAEFGTRKVIKDHSTVGIVMTTDGSIGELPRDSYKAAEAATIEELKKIGKPFVVVVNSKNPAAKSAAECVDEIKKAYGAEAAASLKLTAEDAKNLGVIERILSEKDIGKKEFYERIRRLISKEVDMLSNDLELVNRRYDRFRSIGMNIVKNQPAVRGKI